MADEIKANADALDGLIDVQVETLRLLFEAKALDMQTTSLRLNALMSALKQRGASEARLAVIMRILEKIQRAR